MTFGSGMVMLGSHREVISEVVVAPSSKGSLTQGTCIVVSDIEATYIRVRGAGAKIITELEEQSYGGHLSSVRDPEGQLWNVGSYDPWSK